MSNRELKISVPEARIKIETQIKKGYILVELATKETRDNFKIRFEYWDSHTQEVLENIFSSVCYRIDFEEHKSSEVEYVSSDWIPDIKYYVNKQIIPKLEYLKILLENIDDFKKLKKSNKSLKERIDRKTNIINDANEIIELKPNVFGLGINFNKIISKLKKKSKKQ